MHRFSRAGDRCASRVNRPAAGALMAGEIPERGADHATQDAGIAGRQPARPVQHGVRGRRPAGRRRDGTAAGGDRRPRTSRYRRADAPRAVAPRRRGQAVGRARGARGGPRPARARSAVLPERSRQGTAGAVPGPAREDPESAIAQLLVAAPGATAKRAGEHRRRHRDLAQEPRRESGARERGGATTRLSGRTSRGATTDDNDPRDTGPECEVPVHFWAAGGAPHHPSPSFPHAATNHGFVPEALPFAVRGSPSRAARDALHRIAPAPPARPHHPPPSFPHAATNHDFVPEALPFAVHGSPSRAARDALHRIAPAPPARPHHPPPSFPHAATNHDFVPEALPFAANAATRRATIASCANRPSFTARDRLKAAISCASSWSISNSPTASAAPTNA